MTLCSWDRNRTKMAKSMAVSANTISFFPLYAIFPLSWKLHLKFDLAYWTGGGCQPRRRFSYYVWCSIFLSPRLIWKMTFKGTVCPFPPSSKACRIQRQSYYIHSCKGNLKFKEILSWNKKKLLWAYSWNFSHSLEEWRCTCVIFVFSNFPRPF